MLKIILFIFILLNCYGGEAMPEYKRIIQRTTTSNRIDGGIAELEPYELVIVENLDELGYKNKDGEFIYTSKDKYIVNNIQDLKQNNKYKVGDVIHIRGVLSNDNKYHTRLVSELNDGTGILLKNNLWANLIYQDYVNLDYFENINIEIIKNLLLNNKKIKTKKIYSLSEAYANWFSRKEFPITFFGDSTTDGATTTGHIPSIPTNDGVQINESPNAYSKILEDTLKSIIPKYPDKRIIYNAGFDSQSLWVNNFAMDKFDSIFINPNAPFKDTKMIGFAWGVTDVINSDYPQNVINNYSINLETLIIYSLSKNIQPFLVNPVPMWVGGDNGRNGWQLLSLIEKINKDLAIKYNLEIISLRDGIDFDVNKNGNPLSYFATDKVHPNDFGHSAIAGGILKQICPNVFNQDEAVYNGHPKLIANSYTMPIIQKEVIKVDYDYYFTPRTIKFLLFLEEDRNLIADNFCMGDRYTVENIALATVKNFNTKETSYGNVFSGSVDYYKTGFKALFNSNEFILPLKKGMNEVTIDIKRGFLGTLKFEKNKYTNIIKSGITNYSVESSVKDLIIYTKGKSIHASKFDTESYHLSKGTSPKSLYIEGIAKNILNTRICFNISKDKSVYNYISLLPDKMEFGIYKDGTYIKTGESLKVSNFDILTLKDVNNFTINMSSSVNSIESNDSITITFNGAQAYETLNSTSLILENLKQGYGIGLIDLDINGIEKGIISGKIISNK